MAKAFCYLEKQKWTQFQINIVPPVVYAYELGCELRTNVFVCGRLYAWAGIWSSFKWYVVISATAFTSSFSLRHFCRSQACYSQPSKRPITLKALRPPRSGVAAPVASVHSAALASTEDVRDIQLDINVLFTILTGLLSLKCGCMRCTIRVQIKQRTNVLVILVYTSQ